VLKCSQIAHPVAKHIRGYARTWQTAGLGGSAQPCQPKLESPRKKRGVSLPGTPAQPPAFSYRPLNHDSAQRTCRGYGAPPSPLCGGARVEPNPENVARPPSRLQIAFNGSIMKLEL
jgi:hypothetical protein